MLTDDFDLKTAALTDEERARLLLCMVRYENGGTEMELPGNERILWPMFKWEIDRAKEAAVMEEKARIAASERNRRAAEKRWGKDHASVDNAENAAQCACAETQCEEMRAHAGACGRIAAAQTEDKEKGTQKETEEGERDHIISTPPKPPAKKAEAGAGFDEFWAAYPKKQDKQNALKAWKKLSPDEETRRKIILAVQSQRASPQWQKDGGQFIPLPSTWLNGRRWEDQPTGIPTGRRVSAQMYSQREYTEAELLAVSGDLIAEASAFLEEEADTG